MLHGHFVWSAKKNGLLAKPTHGDKVRLTPPLIIDHDQILESVDIIKRSLNVLSQP